MKAGLDKYVMDVEEGKIAKAPQISKDKVPTNWESELKKSEFGYWPH